MPHGRRTAVLSAIDRIFMTDAQPDAPALVAYHMGLRSLETVATPPRKLTEVGTAGQHSGKKRLRML